MLLEKFFEDSVLLYPNKIAIEQGETKYTYPEVEKIANKLAHFLITKGIGPEEKVVILLPRCAQVPLVMLGVLKAGAAYIPLDPEIPADRLNFIMEDANAKLLITADEILERIGLQLNRPSIFNIDKQLIELDNYTGTKPIGINRTASDLCYIIYTSGTTGNPKGVLLEHKNVVNYINSAKTIYPIKQTDRALQGFSVSFDASIEEIWVPFSAGATLVIGTFDIMRSGDRFASILNNLNITFLSCAPTLLSVVKEDIPDLKILIFGGEVCSKEIATRWCKPDRLVFNTYGPTEAAVIATYKVLSPNEEVTIGRPLPGYDVLLVNDQFESIAAGEEGEILIGGESIARGYLNREDLTTQKFIETDKFKGVSVRYYRTGDLAKYSPNGEIIFLGRADAQIKIRGFRVELQEIESLLTKYEGVQAAAVSLDSNTQQLAAYLVLRKDEEIDREGIARFLRQKLPYYMIPSTLDIISFLPMTSSQKIDRKQLPAPHTPLVFSSQKKIIPPSTEVEIEMVKIISKNILRDNISMDDNFFDHLGGHSLLAAIVVSEMRKLKIFENMSVVDVYKFPILSDLAAELEKKKLKKEEKRNQKREIHTPSRLSYFTCTFFQGLSLLFLILLFGMEWLGPFFVYSYYYQAENGAIYSLFLSLLMYFALLPVLTAFAIGFITRLKMEQYILCF